MPSPFTADASALLFQGEQQIMYVLWKDFMCNLGSQPKETTDNQFEPP